MKKKIVLILMFVVAIYFNFNNVVKGYTVSSNNNPGGHYTSSGSATTATDWFSVGGAAGTQLEAVRIRIFRNGSVVSGMDTYYALANDSSGCYSGVNNVTHCTTSSYNYSSVLDQTGLSCTSGASVSFGCIASTNLGNIWGIDSKGNYINNGVYLKNYLENSNYSNLKSILKIMGYDDTNYNNNDTVIIEPATIVNCNNVKYFGTSTALMKKDVSYHSIRSKYGNACAGNDAYNGKTFQNVFRSLSTNLSQIQVSYTNSYYDTNYTGLGYFKYNISGLGYVDPKATLTIKKYKKDTTTLITSSNVTVGIYSDSSCSTLISGGKLTFNSSTTKELNRGVYYVKETTAPNNYIKDETCHRVDLSSGDDTLSIYNSPTCVSEFNEYGAGITRDQRKYLFEKYGFTQLLDFTETNASVACTNTRDCGISKSYACEGISLNYNEFNENNLSCYLPNISSAGQFCSASFELNTPILKSFNNSFLKSGQLINFLEESLPTLYFKKTCYDLDGNSIYTDFNINNYITNLKVMGTTDDGEVLSVRDGNTWGKNRDESGNVIESLSYEGEKTFILTRKACISKISGKVVDSDKCSGNYEGNYVYVEALVPKFTNKNALYVYPYLELKDMFIDSNGDKINLEISDSRKCIYNFNQEIITTGDGEEDKSKLNLTFRIIDTTNPFPGVFGNGRVIGSNWCKSNEPCIISDSYAQEKIINAPNSKGIKIEDGTAHASSPKYEIVLNSNVIKEIREYNDSHTYDEHDINYVGGSYQNSFLRDYQGYFQIFPSN